jgi:hypothetical protein
MQSSMRILSTTTPHPKWPTRTLAFCLIRSGVSRFWPKVFPVRVGLCKNDRLHPVQ